MLRPFSNISIQQITPYYIDGVKSERDRLIELDFVSSYEVESSYKDHTDTAKIEFPKNVILKQDKALFSQSGTFNIITGGEGMAVMPDGTRKKLPPLLSRGDIVTISDGYYTQNEVNKTIVYGKTIFNGFISIVEAGIPIKIECEDNFYLLKRTPIGISKWTSDMISLCKYMVGLANQSFHDVNDNYPQLTVFDKVDSATLNFSLGYLDIADLTCAQVLSEVRKRFKIESYFVGNELHFSLVYDEDTAVSKYFFEFENNISNDNLEYKKKEDLELSAIIKTQGISKTGRRTRDGNDGTKKELRSILIYWDLASSTFKYVEKQSGQPLPDNKGGQRYEFIYPVSPSDPVPSFDTLFQFGVNQLKKYSYTGFRGSFTTFGFPPVKWGDNVNLVSRIQIDKNGVYKVNKVIYKGGNQKQTQEIFLDYKLNLDLPRVEKTIFLG